MNVHNKNCHCGSANFEQAASGVIERTGTVTLIAEFLESLPDIFVPYGNGLRVFWQGRFVYERVSPLSLLRIAQYTLSREFSVLPSPQ